jgi:hypothetical protein
MWPLLHYYNYRPLTGSRPTVPTAHINQPSHDRADAFNLLLRHDGTTGSTHVGSFAWKKQEIICYNGNPFSMCRYYGVAEGGVGGGFSMVRGHLQRGAGHGSVVSKLELAIRLEPVEKQANYQILRGYHY